MLKKQDVERVPTMTPGSGSAKQCLTSPSVLAGHSASVHPAASLVEIRYGHALEAAVASLPHEGSGELPQPRVDGLGRFQQERGRARLDNHPGDRGILIIRRRRLEMARPTHEPLGDAEVLPTTREVNDERVAILRSVGRFERVLCPVPSRCVLQCFELPAE